MLALAVAAATATAATAYAERGSVSGQVELAPASQRGSPPERTLGFVPRAQNPLRPAEPYDPRPYLVVVLEGPAAARAERADPIEYPIEGATFVHPILPVQVDVRFEIVNRSKHSPRLFSAGDPDLLAGDPLNPGASREAKVSVPYRRFGLRDRDTAHIKGAVVAFPHRLFSRVDDAGRFEIAGVPAGTYTARIWYRHGWLDTRTAEVTVSEGGRARVDIEIPPRLEVSAPEHRD